MGKQGLIALRDARQLSVEVSDLLRRPGAVRSVSFTEELSGLELDMGRVRPGLSFDLTLEALVEGIGVSGTVRGAYALECIRCLRPFEEPFELRLDEVLAYEGQPGAEEGYQITGDVADLEPVVRDAVVLAMPLNPVHAPDCRGLCPICGIDLNEVDCGHRVERTELRWEPLRRLKETMGD